VLLHRQAKTISELQTEVLEQCRLNGMGSEREAKLLSEVEKLTRWNKVANEHADKWANEVERQAAEIERLKGELEFVKLILAEHGLLGLLTP